MNIRSVFCLLAFLCPDLPHSYAQPEPLKAVRAALERMPLNFPESCGLLADDEKKSEDLESALFRSVTDGLENAMGDAGADPATAELRARAFLGGVKELSRELNKSWPENDRFHFDLLRVEPLLLVQMGIGSVETYYAFANTETGYGDNKPPAAWHVVGSDSEFPARTSSWEEVGLHRLHRGTSGRARFLAEVTSGGCAGSWGESYVVREWDPEYNTLDDVLTQEGAVGLGDSGDAPPGPTREHPFAPVGKLETEGRYLKLPYCWFSAIDWWDNPSLCALDTYDLSPDQITFRSREYNRPELVPIAKVMEFAKRRDYPAALGYCASARFARWFVREGPSRIEATENPKTLRTGPGKMRVTFDGGARFDLVRRDGRWLVAAFNEQ